MKTETTYFKTAGEAAEFAKTLTEKKGFIIDEGDWNNQITHGGVYGRLGRALVKHIHLLLGY